MILSGLFGLFGVLAGIIISWYSFEELKEGKKYFKFLRLLSFGLFIAFFLFHYSIVWMVAGLLALYVAVRALSEKSFAQALPLVFAIAWIWPQSQVMTGLLFLTGLFEGGVWSARKKLRAKKVPFTTLSKHIILHYWWYVLPFITSLISGI